MAVAVQAREAVLEALTRQARRAERLQLAVQWGDAPRLRREVAAIQRGRQQRTTARKENAAAVVLQR